LRRTWPGRLFCWGRITYGTAGDLVVAALAGHLEGNIVGGVALDLNGTSIQVIEVLVQELEERRRGELRRKR
jgi:hypothetical protein